MASGSSGRTLVILLSAFSLVGYVLRMNISVASPYMMAELHLDKIQMGQVFSAFMLGYALFQVPWGVFGDRIGPGFTLAVAGSIWAVTTMLTALSPTTNGSEPDVAPLATATVFTLIVAPASAAVGVTVTLAVALATASV